MIVADAPGSQESGRPRSSRRDFLVGRAVHEEILHRGSDIADALNEATHALPPVAHDTVRLETRAMGCAWSIVMNPGPPRQVMVASDALDLVYGAEQLLTVYRNDSDTARLNELAPQGPHFVPPELFSFLLVCQQFWKETERAFDPASGSLIQLWKSARECNRIPDPAEVQAALENSGMQNVVLDSTTESVSYLQSGLKLDFGAIGKGYAVDLAAQHVLSEKISDFLLHGGHSSLIAQGRHATHPGWPVGIKNPLFTEQRYATVMLCNQAMSTSGSNVQYFRHAGRRYGHLLDPRTGWPAQGLLSVTVIAPTATQAEALSTAFYVMGLDKARAYCDDHPEAGAILVPPPVRGRVLEPIVCNLPSEQLFFETGPAAVQST